MIKIKFSKICNPNDWNNTDYIECYHPLIARLLAKAFNLLPNSKIMDRILEKLFKAFSRKPTE